MKYHPSFPQFFKHRYSSMFVGTIKNDLSWAKLRPSYWFFVLAGLLAMSLGMIVIGPLIIYEWIKSRKLLQDVFIEQL